MDGTLRLSTAMGLVSIVWLALGTSVLGMLPPLSAYALTIGLLSFYFPYLIFYVYGPVVSFVGAVVMLFRPIPMERRRIVGFIVFVAALPSMLSILMYTAALVTGRPLFRS